MFSAEEKAKIKEICEQIDKRIKNEHLVCFKGMDKPLFLISNAYHGLWLEHVYDSVFYAQRHPEYVHIAINALDIFIDSQNSEGLYPFSVMYRDNDESCKVQYTQIQECVSFPKLCLMTYRIHGDKELLLKYYNSSKAWDGWYRNFRMTTGRGLAEVFVGFDTGHDGSGRKNGMKWKGNYAPEGVALSASVCPTDCDVAPILAVDLNASLYATEKALEAMARELGLDSEADEWARLASDIKTKIFELLYDRDDAFFYDVDKHGNKRKMLSSTIFHLFMEGVLDKEADAEVIKEIYDRHIKNPEEFWTAYPFPSMAVCDPTCVGHRDQNCWGYHSQALIALRCTMWMDEYGMGKDFDTLCEAWLHALTKCFDYMKLGQELDPLTGEPTRSSEWYSSCMLFYTYAAERLGVI